MQMGEAMAMIAEEAERQGFTVRQTASGMWIFTRRPNTVLVGTPETATGLLDVLSALIFAGLTWPPAE